MNREVKPLYRRENKRALHYRSNNPGSEARYDRHSKKGMSKSMKKVERGLDYTPLFMFLLSKIGQKWDDVFSEAVSRLDQQNPIFWMVDVNKDNNKEFMMTENARYSTLYVDSDGLLQKVNPNLKNEDFEPSCPCCTHTFNGKVLNKKFVSGYGK